ncbi:MAG: 50S ribosomal protein L25 [Bryobacterales bacterium]|nr:50S ribosomal protein L25 [Bryobacterales bacterium]
MKVEIVVNAEKREERGKNAARRCRVSGRIPAVVYGQYKDAEPLALDPKSLTKLIRSKAGLNTIFKLDVAGGESGTAMIVETQYDPVKDTLLHADLKWIDPEKRLKVTVPVYVRGTAVGVKTQGGHLEVVAREVEIDCLPDDIPEQFDVDVTPLRMGQSVRAQDLPLSGSARLTTLGETVLVHVIALRGQAAGEAAATEGAAEPEVAKKGKKEDEGKK